MSIDLHVHSTFSDGTLRPAELVAMAARGGLAAIAITDHDTVEGTAEARLAGLEFGVRVIAGLEMSVRHGDLPLHILGYGIDPDCPALRDALAGIQAARLVRNHAILARLAELGLAVSMAEVDAWSAMGQTGRPHFARLLVEKGLARDIDEAFTHYLGRGARAYVARQIYPAESALAVIRQAGGVSVLAHPTTADPSLRAILPLLTELKALGLDGIEVYYPTHSASVRKKLSALAKKFGLLVTGGSDYHGAIRPGTSLAGGPKFRVPATLLVELVKRLDDGNRPS